ncbi:MULTISPECIES: DUF3613 domain-containing protein [Pseudomonas]|uniref:DUF3613 domain-containing protein n=2 Tax=Pseudomonas TaxID=286 RepID=A0A0W0I5E9_PSEFL|nr:MULTISPECIES: DUF3613 domain-containing protein [Pseudomonas]KTB68308.1 hypothetical protein AO063_00970 [Pseudomonas fluorescens ICMP 11288]RMQ82015.1 hypothetical protein ALP97_01192 [Pseudomonas salomonii]
MKMPYLASLAVLALPLTVMAIEPGPSSPQQAVTESWLTLQSSGKAASNTRQKASAAERDLATQRLLESYKHPIPEYFDQKAGGTVKSGN